MSNSVMFTLLYLLGLEYGYGISRFCRDFETKDDLRVPVDFIFQSVHSELKVLKMEISQLQLKIMKMDIKLICRTKKKV